MNQQSRDRTRDRERERNAMKRPTEYLLKENKYIHFVKLILGFFLRKRVVVLTYARVLTILHLGWWDSHVKELA